VRLQLSDTSLFIAEFWASVSIGLRSEIKKEKQLPYPSIDSTWIPGRNWDEGLAPGGPSNFAKEFESGKPIPHPFGLSYAC